MSKRLYAVLLPVLAIAAMAMTAVAAQAAEPKWEICEKHAGAGTKFTDAGCEVTNAAGTFEWVPIPNGLANKVRVATFGELTLTAPGPLVVKCWVSDRGFIWNLEAGGKDEITGFENFECTSTACATVTVKPNGLPWPSKLIAGPADEIENISVTVNCSGAEKTFTGTLKPKIEGSAAVFTATTGKLKSGAEEAEVTGTDNMRTTLAGHVIRAK